MDGKKKMPPPRPVTVAKKNIPGSIMQACGWALLSACAIAFGHFQLRCEATSVLAYRSDELSDTKAAYFSALWIGTLCCTASQAAAAALALLLPRRHHRQVSGELLAYLALAVAGVGHCMYNGAIYILRPGVYFAVVRHLLMVGDIICVTALYLGGHSVCPRCGYEPGHLRN